MSDIENYTGPTVKQIKQCIEDDVSKDGMWIQIENYSETGSGEIQFVFQNVLTKELWALDMGWSGSWDSIWEYGISDLASNSVYKVKAEEVTVIRYNSTGEKPVSLWNFDSEDDEDE